MIKKVIHLIKYECYGYKYNKKASIAPIYIKTLNQILKIWQQKVF